MRYIEETPAGGQVPWVRECLAHQERIVELQPVAHRARRAPIALMRNQGVVEDQLLSQFEAGVRGHARLVAAAEPVGHDPRRAHQGEHQSAVADDMARQAPVEQREAPLAVAVVDPVLRRKLDPLGPFHRAEGDFVSASARANRRGEQRLVSDELVVVADAGLDIDSRQPSVEPNARGERAFGPEGVRHAELGEDGPSDAGARVPFELMAEGRLAGLGHGLFARHGDAAAAIQRLVQLPKVAAVVLARHHIGRAQQDFPVARLDPQAGHGPGGRVQAHATVLVFQAQAFGPSGDRSRP